MIALCIFIALLCVWLGIKISDPHDETGSTIIAFALTIILVILIYLHI